MLWHYHLKNRWLPAPSPRPKATPATQTMAKMTAAIHKMCSAKPRTRKDQDEQQ